MFDFHGFEMTVFKLLIGVILIILHLRLTGKQQTVQMTPIDFIGNFILGGIIGGVIYNRAFPFAEYISTLLVTFAIISGLNYLTSKLMTTRSLVMGKAYTIIEGGRFTQDALDSPDNKLDPVEFLAELRGMGIFFTQRHQPRTTRSQRLPDGTPQGRGRRQLCPGVQWAGRDRQPRVGTSRRGVVARRAVVGGRR